ncbi:putative ATPase subunit of terminase [Human alphaherpesvirus 3]|uniref:DNA packaging protein n=1 Tax=Human herpesvirus 3 TaxID=10335 RepID=Q2PJ20_HHV3|nr:putative ATPase subunit of terminase [Human alphaherpesvirus 3]ABF21762.1 putative ATPase subunit of terminase [Human alphaherpesvirus 3]ABF21835.1 putative ATPase subunit of terminase [Human alphaherpesvirus 3]ABJ98890.1 ORF45/42 [Human alphaherpesvirus 3]AEW88667.1 DNA packaging protein [Human alphaherpesvirus 3]
MSLIMFGRTLGEESVRYFERLKRRRDERFGTLESPTPCSTRQGSLGNATQIPFLNFAIDVTRRHQAVIPGIGTLHNCCEYIPLFSATARRAMFGAFLSSTGYNCTPNVVLKPWRYSVNANVSPELKKAVSSVQFYEYSPEEAAPHRNAYSGVMNTFRAFSLSDSFCQLSTFTQRFSYLVETSFESIEECGSHGKRAKVDVPIYGRYKGTLELFQKMILMHTTHFISSVLLGDHADRVDCFLRTVFNMPSVSDSVLEHFKQKSTVFLVPRRHGKTWFLVPLIALVMATFRGIKVGYTAHIRKATEPVFEGIKSRLEQWFGANYVDHVKGESITFSFTDGSYSTAVFASSHNTNGIRGQDFNLLFVDEANFIRPDAVQTIVGFLNQTNCKIIFVSSTNTGKASTSFLYNLRGSSDQLLNVVTYVCDDHMPRVLAHSDVTACSCYVLNKPVFITMDGAMRRTADLFMADSFVQEIVGGRKQNSGGVGFDRPLFTKTARERFILYRPSTVANCAILSSVLYVYVDPAFTSNTRASGTGVAIVGRYKSDWIIFGLEHFFLRALTGTSSSEIGRCVTQCLGHILALHPNTFTNVHVSIEGNSSQDSAVAISLAIAQQFAVLEKGNVLSSAPVLLFYHSIPPGCSVAYPFFLLQKQKTPAVDYFVKRFNSGNIIASQELVSLTVKLGVDPVEYLCKQLDNLTEVIKGGMGNLDTKTYTGKGTTGTMSDDLMVALIMSVYIGSSCIPDSVFMPIK